MNNGILYVLSPHFRECRLSVGIPTCKTVNCRSPISIVIGSRLNERVEFIYDLASAHYDHPDTAYAAAPSVGRFKVYCNKIFHRDGPLQAVAFTD